MAQALGTLYSTLAELSQAHGLSQSHMYLARSFPRESIRKLYRQDNSAHILLICRRGRRSACSLQIQAALQAALIMDEFEDMSRRLSAVLVISLAMSVALSRMSTSSQSQRSRPNVASSASARSMTAIQST